MKASSTGRHKSPSNRLAGERATSVSPFEGLRHRFVKIVNETENTLAQVFDRGKAFATQELSHEPSSTFTVVIRDWGVSFAPLSCRESDHTKDFLDHPVGGLGIYLIRKIADRLTYCPLDDGNQITLTFCFK